MLCPPLQESGNPVVCYPVAGYPLWVKASLEPVQEGSGDPSPDNIRAINGRNKVSVTCCGENLLDMSEKNISAYNTSVSVDTSTGTLTHTIETGGGADGGAAWIKVTLPAGTYTFSCGDSTSTDNDNEFKPSITDNNIGLNLYGAGHKTFTISSMSTLSIRTVCNNTVSGVSKPRTVVYKNLMLVRGDTVPTEFVPYFGQTNTLTLPETVYGGEVDAVTGEGQKTWKTVTLDGNSNFTGLLGKVMLLYDFSSNWNRDQKYLSSHYHPFMGGWGNIPNQSFQIVDNALGIHDDRFSSIAEFKAYLAAQYVAGTPVQIAYKLAEPVPFTATGAQPIPALAGVNTVLTDADSATVTGRADPIKRIEDLEAAVASIN